MEYTTLNAVPITNATSHRAWLVTAARCYSAAADNCSTVYIPPPSSTSNVTNEQTLDTSISVPGYCWTARDPHWAGCMNEYV